jgi:hypothetical protein
MEIDPASTDTADVGGVVVKRRLWRENRSRPLSE